MRLNATIIVLTFVGFVLFFGYTLPPFALLFLLLLVIAVLLCVSLVIKYLNRLTLAQWAILNEQLQINLQMPERAWLELEWKYPSMDGMYLGKKINISMFNAEMFGITAPHTRIVIDAIHYGNTLEIRSEGVYTQFEKFWLKTNNLYTRQIQKILHYFGREVVPLKGEVAVGDLEFDRRFYVLTNNAGFVKKLLDPDIRDIMKNDVFTKMGKFVLNQSQLIYTEQININTDFERQRFQKIILLMYMMANRMERIR